MYLKVYQRTTRNNSFTFLVYAHHFQEEIHIMEVQEQWCLQLVDNDRRRKVPQAKAQDGDQISKTE